MRKIKAPVMLLGGSAWLYLSIDGVNHAALCSV